jgi:hypothetical protein
MRALTIRQPWAQLIVDGHKDIENRSWSTKWRGPLLIHAGLQYDTLARVPDGVDRDELADTMARAHRRRGTIVGLVTLVDVVRKDPSSWAQEDQHHWKLADPIAFDTPIMASGRQGLWMPSTREIEAVRLQLEAQGVSA